MCDGWPAGPAPCRFLQPIPTSRDRTRRSIPRFAHESDKISKAVYQALPLCIVAALQGYAGAYATIIAYGTPTSGYWRVNAMDICAWLRGLGLERYEQAFRENAIDEAILPILVRRLGPERLDRRRTANVVDVTAAIASG
jgi:hypothetical protein